jgi:hypothetical protein
MILLPKIGRLKSFPRLADLTRDEGEHFSQKFL